MGDAGFFRGTSTEQDNRFSDKQKKSLKQMNFSKVLENKVDVKKVNLEILKPWISDKITEMLGTEDDVLLEFVLCQLEAEQFPDPKTMQVNLTGFLGAKDAQKFMRELWTLLLNVINSDEGGVSFK